MHQHYRPNGNLQGDDRPMPDRGTTTGMTGHATHNDGFGLGVDDTNRTGSMGSAAKSDPAERSMPRGDVCKG